MTAVLSTPYFAWLILSAAFFATGEFLSKRFALAPSLPLVGVILVVYSLAILAWLPAIYQKNQLSVVGVLWSLLCLLTTVLIGVLVFHERLNAFGIAGIVTAAISIVLLSLA